MGLNNEIHLNERGHTLMEHMRVYEPENGFYRAYCANATLDPIHQPAEGEEVLIDYDDRYMYHLGLSSNIPPRVRIKIKPETPPAFMISRNMTNYDGNIVMRFCLYFPGSIWFQREYLELFHEI